MFHGFRASSVFKKRRRVHNLERKRVIGSNSRSFVTKKEMYYHEVIVNDKVL